MGKQASHSPLNSQPTDSKLTGKTNDGHWEQMTGNFSNSVSLKQSLGQLEHSSNGKTVEETFNLVFLASDALDAEERLQAIFSLNSTSTIRVQEMSQHDPLQTVKTQIAQIASCEDQSVDKIWFLLGADSLLLKALGNRQNRTLIKSWQNVLTKNCQIYFLDPIDPHLSNHLRKLTQANIVHDDRTLPALLLNEVVFVDERVTGYEQLLVELLKKHDAEVVLLDSNQCGINQISEFLVNRNDLQAIHLIGLDQPGTLRLGTSVIDSASIEGEYAGVFSAIGRCFAADGEIRIYGTRFNQGPQGLSSLKALSSTSGAFVVVSRQAREAVAESLEQTPHLLAPTWPAGFQALLGKENAQRVSLPDKQPFERWDVELANVHDPMEWSQDSFVQTQSIRTQLPSLCGHLKSEAARPDRKNQFPADFRLTLGWLCISLAVVGIITIMFQHLGVL